MITKLTPIAGLVTAILASATLQAASAPISQPPLDIPFNNGGFTPDRYMIAQSQIIPFYPESKPGDVQPHLTAQRKALLLVRPEMVIDRTLPLEVVAHHGTGSPTEVGRLRLNPPENLPKTIYQVDGLIQGLPYAAHTWSTVLPEEWIKPNLQLTLWNGTKKFAMGYVKVGAPSELLINTIDIGLLSSPSHAFDFAKNPELHREFQQTIPVGKMVVNNYAPLALSEVMMPDGTLLTGSDPLRVWDRGSMQERIGVELISQGINSANHGLHSTAGVGTLIELPVAQLTANKSRGMYRFGQAEAEAGHAGAGVATMTDSRGFRASRVLGQSLGASEGGFNAMVHRPAGQNNSTWGWDADRNLFFPNLFHKITNRSTCLDGQCQAPLAGYPFNVDPLSTRWEYDAPPVSGFNNFSLYTPHSAAAIQQFLESKAVFDRNSSTGFSKWNAASKRMEPYVHTVRRGGENIMIDAPVQGQVALNEASVTELLAGHHITRLSIRDDHWSPSIQVPAASAHRGRIIIVEHAATSGTDLAINGQQIMISNGTKKVFTSDGNAWQEGPIVPVANEHAVGENSIATLLAGHNVVRVRLWDGHWGPSAQVPAASAANQGQVIVVEHDAGWNSSLTINGQQLPLSTGVKKVFVSNGSSWKEGAIDGFQVAAKPSAFGVPVTTLVGYYDPEASLPSYLYPALHGAHGYVYPDETKQIAAGPAGQCRLQVETANGVLNFKLADRRLSANVMNKFHVNIGSRSAPLHASVICRGTVLTEGPVAAAPKDGLPYTVNGEPGLGQSTGPAPVDQQGIWTGPHPL